MKLRMIMIMALMLGVSRVSANSSDVEFGKFQRDFAGTTLNYRKATIANADEGSKSLVIYLHGGSSCGTDNETQMGEAGIDSISNYLVRQGVNATFVVPQCPDRTKGWGGMANSVKALLDFMVRTEGIDTTRIYIFGGSMGGTGTWKVLSTYPDYFAAGMPCAANPTGMNAANVATTPVLNVMGLADKIMDEDVRTTALSFIAELQSLGDDARYEAVDGWTHEVTCIQSYTTERLNWVFAHRRSVATGITSVPTGTARCVVYDLQGQRHTTFPRCGICIVNGVKVMKQAE